MAEQQPSGRTGESGSADRSAAVQPSIDAAVLAATIRRSRWRTFALVVASLGWIVASISIVIAWYYHDSNQEYYNTTGGIFETYHSGAKQADDKVAIIHVQGLIVDGKGYVRSQIERIKDDPDIKAIVVRVDSPGGTVTGSDYIFHYLCEMQEEKKIPLVVSMGSIAASGGYYVSMAVGEEEDSIFAEPTTTTGSIGVILPHYDVTGLMSRFDVKDDSIRSHARKQMLSMTREITDEHRELLQAQVDEMFTRFRKVVFFGRPKLRPDAADGIEGDAPLLDPKTGRDLATGETFSAEQAEAFGLVDDIGFLEDAIDRAIDKAGLKKEEVRVIQYTKPAPLIDLPAFIQASEYSQDSVDALGPFQYHQPYYLTYDPFPLLVSRILRNIPN